MGVALLSKQVDPPLKISPSQKIVFEAGGITGAGDSPDVFSRFGARTTWLALMQITWKIAFWCLRWIVETRSATRSGGRVDLGATLPATVVDPEESDTAERERRGFGDGADRDHGPNLGAGDTVDRVLEGGKSDAVAEDVGVGV